jgi:hypothetical protein
MSGGFILRSSFHLSPFLTPASSAPPPFACRDEN